MSPIRKIYFCINPHGFDHEIGLWLIVSIRSVLAHTSLRPVVLYAGEEDHITRHLRAEGAEVIIHRSRLLDIITAKIKKGELPARCEGALLRYEIASICDDEWALYADCDTYFLADPRVDTSTINLVGAVASPTDTGSEHFNSGVLVFNTKSFLARIKDFFEYLERTLGNWLPSSVDEMPFNEYFRGEVSALPREVNWRPMFGFNDKADVIHFHGFKLQDAIFMLERDFRGEGLGSLITSGYIYEVAKHTSETLFNAVRYIALIERNGHFAGTSMNGFASRLMELTDNNTLIKSTLLANCEMSVATSNALKASYIVDRVAGSWSTSRITYAAEFPNATYLKLHLCNNFGAGRITITFSSHSECRSLEVIGNTSVMLDIQNERSSSLDIYWAGIGIDCHIIIGCRDRLIGAENLSIEIVSIAESLVRLFAVDKNGQLGAVH